MFRASHERDSLLRKCVSGKLPASIILGVGFEAGRLLRRRLSNCRPRNVSFVSPHQIGTAGGNGSEKSVVSLASVLAIDGTLCLLLQSSHFFVCVRTALPASPVGHSTGIRVAIVHIPCRSGSAHGTRVGVQVLEADDEASD